VSVARRRLRDEVQARVLGPYRDSDQWWWLGLRKKDLNNWTPAPDSACRGLP
jgi:hypothetical protein